MLGKLETNGPVGDQALSRGASGFDLLLLFETAPLPALEVPARPGEEAMNLLTAVMALTWAVNGVESAG